MGQSLTNADAVLKEHYGPGLRNQINNDIPLLNLVEKNTRDIDGRRAVLALHTKRSSGVGARGEGGTLPTAGNQGTAEERIPLNYNYGRIKLSGPVLRASKSDKGSFVRALDLETKGIASDLKRDVNRQLWGTSDSVIATCGVTSNATTVVLDSGTSEVQMQQLEVGMKIDIGTKANPTLRASNVEILTIDESGETFTVGAAITTAATDFVFRAGAAEASSVSHELTGLQTIVDSTGTLFNVNPTTHPRWASYELAVSGAITESAMAKTQHKINRASGEYADLIVCSDGVFRSYANLLTSLKRFTNTVNLKGGYSGLDFTAGGPNTPVVWDRDCPSGSQFFLKTDALQEYQMSDWEWMDEDGAVLSRVSGEDAYEAVFFKYHELATDARNQFGKLTGITEA